MSKRTYVGLISLGRKVEIVFVNYDFAYIKFRYIPAQFNSIQPFRYMYIIHCTINQPRHYPLTQSFIKETISVSNSLPEIRFKFCK